MMIREAALEDFEAIWPIFHEIVSEGKTYSFSRDTSKEEARKLWMEIPRVTYVIEDNREIVGRLPKACSHPTEGYVDALIMYKWFEE
jgi:hypothetical protein